MSHQSTIIIEHVVPELDAGRYPVKREVGDRLEVSADIFKEGHDVLAAVVQYRPAKETTCCLLYTSPSPRD